MKKLNLLFLLFFVLSCKENINKTTSEKKCNSKKIESIFLDKYLVKIDSCQPFNNFPKVEYFYNQKLFMSGFSDRNNKVGEWSFFNQKGTKEVSGNFEKSQPKGKWSFNDLGNINWKFFNDKEGKYIVSAPDDWFYFGVENTESYGVLDKFSKDGNDYNLKFIITSYSLNNMEESVNELFVRTVKEFEKNFSEIKAKKIDTDYYDEVYEIQSVELNNGQKYFNKELIYSHKNRFYLLSISLNEKANYEYSIIREIMETSFKIYTN